MSKVIIQCNAFIKVDDFGKLRETIKKDFETGCLVLPSYCSLKAILDNDGEIEIVEGE